MSATAAEEDSAPPATGGSSSSAASSSVPTAKKIFIVKNGAMYSRPQRVVIPLRLVGKWEAILQLLDETCSVPGGIHRVVNVEDWKAAKSFDELEDGKLYVVLNKFESVQKLDYQGMANDTSRSSSPRRKQAEPKPIKRAGPNVPSRWAEKDSHCRFRIYVNKSNIVRPFVVNLNMTEIQKFSGTLQGKICSPLEIVFKRIEQNCSLTLPENKPIRKMFTLDGVLLTDPSELTNDAAYVVAANEPFVDLNYEARRLKNVIHHGPLAGKYQNTKYLGNLPSADKSRYAAQSRKAAEQQRGRKTHRSDRGSENGDSTYRRDDHKMDNSPRNGTHDERNGYDSPREDHYDDRRDDRYDDRRDDRYDDRRDDRYDDRRDDRYDDRRDDRKESIARFGEEGAPKLVERQGSKPADDDVLSADYDRKNEQDREASTNGDLKEHDRETSEPLDNRNSTPRPQSRNGAHDDAAEENGATTAYDSGGNAGDQADEPKQEGSA